LTPAAATFTAAPTTDAPALTTVAPVETAASATAITEQPVNVNENIAIAARDDRVERRIFIDTYIAPGRMIVTVVYITTVSAL